ncbi:MAG TPA: PQQ-binding-like beta-propeller repeat protein [Planktothrix sp.]|jgi:outer membrane protein assembly factor BamB
MTTTSTVRLLLISLIVPVGISGTLPAFAQQAQDEIAQAPQLSTVQTDPSVSRANPAKAAPAQAPAAGKTPLKGQASHTSEGDTKQALTADQMLKAATSLVGRYRGTWQMFLQNPCHTGNAAVDLTHVPIGRLHWSFPAEGPIDSSPAIYKGVVYVGSDDGNVYAVDERTGSMLWHTKLGDKVKSSPAVAEGIVVIGCEDKKLYALDSHSGRVLWSFEAGDRISSSPAVVDNVAYVGSWDGYLYAIDVKTGALKWKFETEGRITSSPAVGPDMVIVSTHGAGSAPAAHVAPPAPGSAVPSPTGVTATSGFLGGSVFALNTADGSVLWQYKTGGKIFSSPLIFDGLVYFGSWDKTFYAVELATGKLKWKFRGSETFSISPVAANGKVFIGNDDLKMYCLDSVSGRLLWKTALNSPVPLLTSSPAIEGNMLYVGSSDANVYALDTRNGGIKWKYKTQRPIVSSPAVSLSGVCVGSQDGNLYSLD